MPKQEKPNMSNPLSSAWGQFENRRAVRFGVTFATLVLQGADTAPDPKEDHG